MKPSKYTFFTSLLCASGLSAGLCFCVMTSFAVPADGLSLVCACVLAALLFSALLLLPKSWVWLLTVAALAGGGLYILRAQLIESISALVAAVTQQYSEAIPGIQTVHLTDTSGMDATLILILIAALYALLCSWTVMRSESLVYLLVLTLPVLALCLIILQTPPAAWAILLVVGVLALLLLTQLLRARQAGEGNRLALLLAAPLALLIGLLAVLFPADTYDRAEWSDHLQETISTAADKLTLFRRDAKTGQVKFTSPISPSTLGSYLWDSSVTGVNLNRVGPQRQFGRSVMRVKATLGSSWAGASFYLRGDSMAVYEDNRWKPLPENAYPDMKNMHNPLLAGEAVVSFQPEVTIETDMKSGIYYIPYNATAFPETRSRFTTPTSKTPRSRRIIRFPMFSRAARCRTARMMRSSMRPTHKSRMRRGRHFPTSSRSWSGRRTPIRISISRVFWSMCRPAPAMTSIRRLCRTEKILCRGSCTTAKPVTVCIMRLRRRFCCDVLAFRRVM